MNKPLLSYGIHTWVLTCYRQMPVLTISWFILGWIGIPTQKVAAFDGELTIDKKAVIINAVAFSVDGKLFAAAPGSAKLPLRIWNTATFETVQSIYPEFRAADFYLFQCIAFSPETKVILLGTSNSSGKTWGSVLGVDTLSGKEQFRFRAFPGEWKDHRDVRAIVYSPDGKYLVSRCSRHIQIRETSNLNLYKQIITRHRHYGSALAVSPDGKVLAYGDDEYVVFWSFETRGELIRFRPPRYFHEFVISIAFSPDGKRLAVGRSLVGASVPRSSVYGLESNRELFVLSNVQPKTNVSLVAFSPDQKMIAGQYSSDAVALWNADDGGLLRVMKGHKGQKGDQKRIHALAFSPDGKYLATGDGYRTIRFWNPTTGKLEKELVFPVPE